MDTEGVRNGCSDRRPVSHRRLPFSLLTLFTLLLTLIPTTALAQGGAIRGTIRDADTGAALAAVEVTVLDAAGTTIAGGSSGQDGTFRITEVPAGTYTVRFNSAGWRTHSEPGVVVTEGQVTSLVIGLSEQLFSMNPITATVQRGVEEKLLEAPASIHVVDDIQIKSKASLSTTDFIDNVSGVDVITTGVQSNYFVTRGFNNIFSGAVMYLTDYRIARVPSLRANISHLNPTVPADIGRIEVVLGPGSAVYGPNTANGVVHQITTSPIDDPGLVLSVAGGARNQKESGAGPVTVPDNTKGLFQTQGRIAFKASDKFGIKVSGQYLGGTDFIFIDPDEFALRQAAQACLADPSSQACLLFPPTVTDEDLSRVGVRDSVLNNWSVDVRADWRPSDETEVIFSYGHTTSGTSIDLTGIGAGQVVDWSYNYFQTRVHWKEFFANVYYNVSNAGDTYLLRSGEPIVDKSSVFATQLQNTSFLGSRQSFTYGVDFLQTTPRTDGTITGVNEDDDNITEVGGFVQSQTSLSQKFDLVLALRADYNSVVKPVVWSPRAAFMFKPTPEQNLRVTYNRAFSSPTTNNLFLDLLARVLPVPGTPFAYPLNTQGTTDEGFTFSRTDGRADFKSPFAPLIGQSNTAFMPTTTPNLWALAVATAGALDPALGALLGSLPVPTEDQVGIVTALFDQQSLEFVPDPRGVDGIADIPAIDNQITNTIEFGYKGLVEEQFLFDFAFYWSRIQDFIGPLGIVTPNVALNGADIAAYLAGFGIPPAQAAVIGETLGSIPLGVLTPEQVTVQQNALLFTYQNFGDFDVVGLDFSAEWQFSPQWFFGMRMNWVNKDMFNSGVGGDALCDDNPLFPTCVSLNAPKFKTSASVGYRGWGTGFFGNLGVRYIDSFFANSGAYVGPVDSYATMDASFGYSIPALRGMSVQCDRPPIVL
ncbi:MAG: TonB-dependent receptor [Gemmatimonadales bacterium]